MVATAVYYAASRRLRALVDHAVICGLAYGVVVYLFMYYVVLPLSAIHAKNPYPLVSVVTALGIHMLCVGLPIALVVRRYLK
jgi:fructose-specific phosphotransferase system IIC component